MPSQRAAGHEADTRLVLVSNRGPIEYRRDQGERVARRGGGGLVSALSGLAARRDAVWICNAITDEDRVVAREYAGRSLRCHDGSPGLVVRMVETDPAEYRQFYNVAANPTLWFVQHSLWESDPGAGTTGRELVAFASGYSPVNEKLAGAVVEEVDRTGATTVMIHDYHLYLLPAFVRRQRPDVVLHHFVHVPWPRPDAWRALPARVRDPLIGGLLCNDIVAFHIPRYARAFLDTCQDLLGLSVSVEDSTVSVDGRTVAVRWYPASVGVADLEHRARSAEAVEAHRRLAALRDQRIVLRVDRADPSKNIVRGFEAFDRLLIDHPELAGAVTFLALLQPSRLDVPAYSTYMSEIHRVVADINRRHGTVGWRPIDLRVENNLPQALAAYRLFDVLVVNPVADGMNLVAKEGMVLNENDGVLVLSEHAGAHAELAPFCETVHPLDIEGQAEALWAALTMGREQRRARRYAAAQVIRANDVHKWLRDQLADIQALHGTGTVDIRDITGGRPDIRWPAHVELARAHPPAHRHRHPSHQWK